jgi:hypothetical protein
MEQKSIKKIFKENKERMVPTFTIKKSLQLEAK